MAHDLESMFVVTEKDKEGIETAPYLAADLSKLQKIYAPKIMPGHFEQFVLDLPEWTFGLKVRRATAKDAKDFQDDTEVIKAAHEYNNLDQYRKIRESALADEILFAAFNDVKDDAALGRFLEKTGLTTSKLEAMNRRSSTLVNASDEWLDMFGAYVASKSTAYKSKKTGQAAKRTKEAVIADWKDGSSKLTAESADAA